MIQTPCVKGKFVTFLDSDVDIFEVVTAFLVEERLWSIKVDRKFSENPCLSKVADRQLPTSCIIC